MNGFISIFLWTGGILGYVALFLLWPILTLTVGRKFDKLFKETFFFPLDPRIPILSHGIRSMGYAMCIVFKNRSHKDRYAYWSFHGYDFQANTNLFEKVLSWAFIWMLSIEVFTSLIFLMLHLLGYSP